MNCKNCGASLSAEDQFCKNCGATVNAQNNQINGGATGQNVMSSNNSFVSPTMPQQTSMDNQNYQPNYPNQNMNNSKKIARR